MQCDVSPSAQWNQIAQSFAAPGWSFFDILLRIILKQENLIQIHKTKLDSMGQRFVATDNSSAPKGRHLAVGTCPYIVKKFHHFNIWPILQDLFERFFGLSV